MMIKRKGAKTQRTQSFLFFFFAAFASLRLCVEIEDVRYAGRASFFRLRS